MKLKLKNFQSIPEAEVDFPVGITLIRGANASGKSALYRAIKAIVLNPNGTKHYVKHGAKEAEVTLVNNGETLTWKRTKSSVSYHYKDQDYVKASKAKSSDYCDLGFYVNDKNKIVNMLDEWDVLFPFGESDTDLFKIFEDIFNISDSAKVIDTMKADENACNKELSDIRNLIDSTKDKISSIDNLSKEVPKEKIEMIQAVLNKKAIFLDKLHRDVLSVRKTIGLSSEDIPTIKLGDYLEKISEYNALQEKLNYVRGIKSLPSGLSTAPILDDTVLNDCINYRRDLVDCYNLIKSIAQYDHDALVSSEELEIKKSQLAEVDMCPLCGQQIK